MKRILYLGTRNQFDEYVKCFDGKYNVSLRTFTNNEVSIVNYGRTSNAIRGTNWDGVIVNKEWYSEARLIMNVDDYINHTIKPMLFHTNGKIVYV